MFHFYVGFGASLEQISFGDLTTCVIRPCLALFTALRGSAGGSRHGAAGEGGALTRASSASPLEHVGTAAHLAEPQPAVEGLPSL